MKILSIDWDYFFPSSVLYDWAHMESPLMIDIVWQLRCGHIHPRTKEEVLDHYLPNVPDGFWDFVINRFKIPVVVADSHFHIWDMIGSAYDGESIHIDSIDAHHDCGYANDDPEMVRCSNWAHQCRLVHYVDTMTLIYPEWRKEEEEGWDEDSIRPEEITTSLPDPQEYDVIFACRSGAWTPPWCDADFMKFLKDGGFKSIEAPFDDILTKVRYPATMEEALKVRATHREAFVTASVSSSSFIKIRQEKGSKVKEEM